MSAKEEFAKRLKAIRKASSLTQQAVAAALGVDRSTYTYYETGKTSPDVFALTRLAQMFGVSTDQLLGKMTETMVLRDDDSSLFDDPAVSRFSKLTNDEQILVLQFRQLDEQQRIETTQRLYRILAEKDDPAEE